MQHLPIERLAELGDVEPSRDEAEHLASCAQCSRERAAYRRLASLAGDERSRIGVPLTDWGVLRTRLAHDGLMRREGANWRRIALGNAGGFLRFAAAALLVVGGIVGGRVSAGMSYTQALALRDSAPATEAAPSATFSSPTEALAVLNQAYEQYSSAATYLAANDTVSVWTGVRAFPPRLAFLATWRRRLAKRWWKRRKIRSSTSITCHVRRSRCHASADGTDRSRCGQSDQKVLGRC